MGEIGKRSRRARASAVATAVAISAPILFLGGAIARAAESSSEAPTSVSVSYTDASGQPVGPDGSTTSGGTSSAAQDLSVPVNASAPNAGTSGNTGTSGDSLQQTIAVVIRPGPLTVTPSSESITFTRSHDGGSLASSLSPVTVVDARGSLVGWDATISLQSVEGVSAADLAAAKMCVSSDPVTVVAGNPPEVKAGKHTCGTVGDSLTLFYAPPNGGGGTFADTGRLTLDLPVAADASTLTATLAVTVH